jgi:PAS domain S-box-containing protein
MNVRLASPEDKVYFGPIAQGFAVKALRSNHVVMSDLHRSRFTDEIHLDLAIPLAGRPASPGADAPPLGVIVVEVDPKKFIYPRIQNWPTPSETAETLLIRREGNEAVFLNELRFQKNAALALRVSLEKTDQPAVKAALGQEGVVEGVDYRGVPVLAAVRAVPDSPWFLVAKIDTAEVYAPMRERFWLTVLFVGALLFGLAAAVGFLWRQQHAALYREKYESQTRMRAVTDSAQDAILMMDPQGRVSYWNPAAERMLGYTSAEALGQNLHQLIAPQRYHGTHHAAFREFQRTGRGGAIGKTLELEARRKDGREVPVALSLSSIQIGGEWHAVGIVRDESERKRAQEYRERLLARRQGINLLQQSLLEPAPLEDKLRKVTDGIVRLFDADFCRVWLIRPGDLCQGKCIHAEADDGPHACRSRDRCLHLVASSGRYTHIDGEGHRRVPIGCYKIGCVASAKEHTFLTNDAPNDPRVHNHQWARELGLVSFAGYQIRVPGEDTLGVLALFSKHPIDESEDAMLDGLSATAALVVQQATAQEALREAKNYTDSIISSMTEMLVVLSPDGTIATVNEAICRSLGYA